MKKLIIVLLFFLFSCKSCHQTKETMKIPDESEKCGECLYLNTGNVCTVEGTYFNSCLAICKQVKILCEGKCPCKTEK